MAGRKEITTEELNNLRSKNREGVVIPLKPHGIWKDHGQIVFGKEGERIAKNEYVLDDNLNRKHRLILAFVERYHDNQGSFLKVFQFSGMTPPPNQKIRLRKNLFGTYYMPQYRYDNMLQRNS